MVKKRKWTLFGLVGLLLGGMAVLTSFFVRRRKSSQHIY